MAVSTITKNLADDSSIVRSVTGENNVSILNGGYIQIGNIVVLSIKCKTGAQVNQNVPIISGIPFTQRNIYLNIGSGYDTNAYSCRSGSEKIYSNVAIPANTEFNINGCYFSG